MAVRRAILRPMTYRSKLVASAIAIATVGCAIAEPASDREAVASTTATAHQVIEIDPTSSTTLYAMSDLHGGYDRAAALLAANGILERFPDAPKLAKWNAGTAILVVAGDMIDKGPRAVEVIDLLRTLQPSAEAVGGKVVVLLGNHEAEFLVDPSNDKASAPDGIDHELDELGIDPKDIAHANDSRGKWLRALPIAARVGDWFFSHAGNTKGRSLAELDLVLRNAVSAHSDYDDPELVGNDSILEAREWYADIGVAKANAAALGVSHVVFGHQPMALGPRGAIATTTNGLLFRIDCGMSPDVNDSTGCLFRVRRLADGTSEVADQLDASARSVELWRTAATSDGGSP